MPLQSFDYPGLGDDNSFGDLHLDVRSEPGLSGASTPTIRTSVTELQKIIKKYQLENGKLKLEVSELKNELATLIAAQPKKGRRGRKTNEEALTPEAQIAKYGAYFQAAYEPWVELDVFVGRRPETNGQNLAHFGTTDAENADRITQELFGLLPRNLHPAVQANVSLGKAFVVALNQQRVNSIRRMRDCADIVFREYKDLPAGWFLGSFDRNIDLLKAFLKFNKADKAYPNLPPICYPGLKKDQARCS